MQYRQGIIELPSKPGKDFSTRFFRLDAEGNPNK